MIVVKNAAYTIRRGTTELKYFSFFKKKANKPASVSADREKKGKKKVDFLVCA